MPNAKKMFHFAVGNKISIDMGKGFTPEAKVLKVHVNPWGISYDVEILDPEITKNKFIKITHSTKLSLVNGNPFLGKVNI